MTRFACGFIMALLLVGCAGLFPYTRYGLDLEEGKLLHYETETKDLPLTACARDEAGNFKCVVMFGYEFFKLKSDYERLVDQLEECQRQ